MVQKTGHLKNRIESCQEQDATMFFYCFLHASHFSSPSLLRPSFCCFCSIVLDNRVLLFFMRAGACCSNSWQIRVSQGVSTGILFTLWLFLWYLSIVLSAVSLRLLAFLCLRLYLFHVQTLARAGVASREPSCARTICRLPLRAQEGSLARAIVLFVSMSARQFIDLCEY